MAIMEPMRKEGSVRARYQEGVDIDVDDGVDDGEVIGSVGAQPVVAVRADMVSFSLDPAVIRSIVWCRSRCSADVMRYMVYGYGIYGYGVCISDRSVVQCSFGFRYHECHTTRRIWLDHAGILSYTLKIFKSS